MRSENQALIAAKAVPIAYIRASIDAKTCTGLSATSSATTKPNERAPAGSALASPSSGRHAAEARKSSRANRPINRTAATPKATEKLRIEAADSPKRAIHALRSR